ncbi:MAG TPA: hypothetical protein ACFYD4_07585 [Candidatus Wunengus sp. YC61]|uniref:hypothetical protein n=1 Tax=Candidatus Wunengus sp. YC61 TaxID=3367698 RepID=UPI004024FDFE
MIEKLLVWILPVLLTVLLTSIITRKHKAKERIDSVVDSFIEPLLRFKAIFDPGSIPEHALYDRFLSNLFSDQDKAMIIIRDKMNRKTKAYFDKKWTKYKEDREKYKHYWNTGPSGKALLHINSKQLIKFIDELIKIAKKI